MKTTKSIILSVTTIVFVGLSGISCGLTEKADVPIETNFSLDFSIDEDLEDPVNPYPSSDLLDITSNDKVKEYEANVKKIEVTRITYQIQNFESEGPVTMTSGSLSFARVGQAAAATANITKSGILLGNTGEVDLEGSASAFTSLAQILLEDHKAQVTSTANLSDAPFQFNLHVKFYVTVTANPF